MTLKSKSHAPFSFKSNHCTSQVNEFLLLAAAVNYCGVYWHIYVMYRTV
jgi:hypothetical protein